MYEAERALNERIRQARNRFRDAALQAGFESTSSQFTSRLDMNLRRPSWVPFAVSVHVGDDRDPHVTFGVIERVQWGESSLGTRSVLSIARFERLARSPARVAAFLDRIATSSRVITSRDRRRSRRRR